MGVASLNYSLIFGALIWLIFLWLSFYTRIPLMLVLTGLLTCGFGAVLYVILPSVGLMNSLFSFIIVLLGIILIAYGFFSAKH